MRDCTFELNGEPMSVLKFRTKAFPAFSGKGAQVNQRRFACPYGSGPIAPGMYFILDSESGGPRGLFNGAWFALYAMDNRVDDDTFRNEVMRGRLRLQARGTQVSSEGCIVIDDAAQFAILRAMLKSESPRLVPRSDLKAYGTLMVV
ncbi:tlde1 domain-containing protein [Noviherbaspirillum denitrificans]|uniref:Tlde1 domain-containing protein n=1 Tax=Noviherbaspirillum denitrificans TaxID=1968433 RepID=A0A254TJC1_9BURK|nr:tlde1 domain-containing protein [Noviherbaspirillum denitrificans]OWW19808.1 hypothetical protein AYR66_10145 [Noviherbaspirillum denitrificans]